MGTLMTRQERRTRQAKMGRIDAAILFTHLRRKKGVDKVVRVSVLDMETNDHSDEEIIKALEGLDWQKLDLCADTIYYVHRML